MKRTRLLVPLLFSLVATSAPAFGDSSPPVPAVSAKPAAAQPFIEAAYQVEVRYIAGGVVKQKAAFLLRIDAAIDLAGGDDFGGNMTPEHFPITGKRGTEKVNLVVVNMNTDTTTPEQVLAYLKATGLKPAKIEHLLALAAQHRKLTCLPSLMPLGSSYRKRGDGKKLAFYPAYLKGEDDKVWLSVGGGGMNARYIRFLAIKA